MPSNIDYSSIRFWVVRAGKGGEFYDTFIKHGLVALGHWNGVIEGLDELPCGGKAKGIDIEQAKASIERLSAENNKAQASKYFNQGRSFIHDMNVKDVVLTTSNDSITVGRILSEPYIDHSPLSYHKHQSKCCDYLIRRKVKWSSIPIAKAKIPHVILRALSASSAIYSLDKHSQTMKHWLDPVHTEGKDAFFSLKINSEDGISNVNIGDIQQAISQIEMIANLLSKKPDSLDNLENLDSFFRRYRESNELHATTQSEFMSPGVIWTVAELADPRVAKLFTLICLCVFSSESPAVELYSTLSSVDTNIIDSTLAAISDSNYINEAIDKLSLNVPSTIPVMTETIEEQSIDDFPPVVDSSNSAL
ncbi:hypothetical protein Q4498_01475 [Neptunomonas phycophila]|uniref:hypothetical protein n=1 Tax=Neptunomonas phycophila TaxID=1572645 RepID=UPI0026E33F34|nr:hypothetical protein [Neptunomonas phycophila]MDO6466767.1 hypothetical protein [Neptunomonas phycophila]